MGFIFAIFLFFPPCKKAERECSLFFTSSLLQQLIQRPCLGGGIPGYKIKPPCPSCPPPPEIHSFAFPCCNLAVLARCPLIPTSSQPRSSRFLWDLTWEGKRGGEGGNTKQRGGVDSGWLSAPLLRGWGLLVYVCLHTCLGGLFTLTAATAGGSLWINLHKRSASPRTQSEGPAC